MTEKLIEYYGTRMKLSGNKTRFEQCKWCTDQFGVGTDRWFSQNNYIYFKHEKGFTWYLLKWG